MTRGKKSVHVERPLKNFDVTFDIFLTTEKEAKAIYSVRIIGPIRQYIRKDACKTTADALITSRLDYMFTQVYWMVIFTTFAVVAFPP